VKLALLFIAILGLAITSCSLLRSGPVQPTDPADPANLAHYREENTKLMPPLPGENRVVFFGDSITENWKLAEYFPGRPVINRGIHSQTTAQMVVRFRTDVIELKPRVVVILAGTNDLAEKRPLDSIQANIASMAELAHAGGIGVVLASVLPVRDIRTLSGRETPNTTLRPLALISAVNDRLKKYSGEKGFVYLDYFSAMADENGMLGPELSADGLHPNATGYEVMKPLVDEAIKSALEGAIILAPNSNKNR
jgi:lysophospholipase L1-like esterase